MFEHAAFMKRAALAGLGAVLAAVAVPAIGSTPAQAQGGPLSFFGLGKSNDGPKQASPRRREPMFCPEVLVQPGTAALRIYERGKDGDPMALRYQASFAEFARECVDLGAEVGIRIGVMGRALVGPKGTPGQTLDVPVRFVVMDDKRNVILSSLTRLKVTIPQGQTGVSFSHVEEVGVVPFPGNAFRRWSLRAGFDSQPGRRSPQG